MHLRAAAGAGKTFVAVHSIIAMLERDPSSLVLIVSRTISMVLYIVRWVLIRSEVRLRSQGPTLALGAPGHGMARVGERMNVLASP